MNARPLGFADPVLEAQTVFRSVMDALARPGKIVPLAADLSPPAPLTPELAAIALTLTDHETPVWLDEALATDEVAAFLRFHTGARLVRKPGEAMFALAVAPGRLPRFAEFAQGTDEYPDRSTTLVLAVDSLADDSGFVLDGPGIRESARLAIAPVPADFVAERARNHAVFPRGVDLVLVAHTMVAALPRTTGVSEG